MVESKIYGVSQQFSESQTLTIVGDKKFASITQNYQKRKESNTPTDEIVEIPSDTSSENDLD